MDLESPAATVAVSIGEAPLQAIQQKPANAPGGWGGKGRPPMRKRIKMVVLSPEAQRAADARLQAEVDRWREEGRIKQEPAKWADGARASSLFSTKS